MPRTNSLIHRVPAERNGPSGYRGAALGSRATHAATAIRGVPLLIFAAVILTVLTGCRIETAREEAFAFRYSLTPMDEPSYPCGIPPSAEGRFDNLTRSEADERWTAALESACRTNPGKTLCVVKELRRNDGVETENVRGGSHRCPQ